jgi:hypothetical protein
MDYQQIDWRAQFRSVEKQRSRRAVAPAPTTGGRCVFEFKL